MYCVAAISVNLIIIMVILAWFAGLASAAVIVLGQSSTNDLSDPPMVLKPLVRSTYQNLYRNLALRLHFRKHSDVHFIPLLGTSLSYSASPPASLPS